AHSIAEPDIRACAGRGPLGLVHFDTHTDTGAEVFGVEASHGTPMYRLVEQGHVDPMRYVQIGLRGYWPGPQEFGWQEERGITSFFMHDVQELGIREVVERTLDVVGDGPAYVTVDVDVLDPAFAPGTGTPEPGGMTSGDLLWACRALGERLDVVGAEVVEVIPTAVGSADVTALVADRIVPGILTGIALPRRCSPAPAVSACRAPGRTADTSRASLGFGLMQRFCRFGRVPVPGTGTRLSGTLRGQRPSRLSSASPYQNHAKPAAMTTV